MDVWHKVIPILAFGLLAAALSLPGSPLLTATCALMLVAAVVSAVHHAEVVAHRVGEPYGTLVLALAITAIEVALIVSLMFAAGPAKAALARDTIYATVMIISSGVIGICLLLGGLRHREQRFRAEGAGAALSALAALSTLVLILPEFTTSAPGASYSTTQLIFVAISSLLVWCAFVFFQTVRHRDYFLPANDASNQAVHADPPSNAQSWMSFVLLLMALVAVVGLAKTLSPAIEAAVASAGAPAAVVGIIIAMVVLLPEGVSAIRAALANRLQTSMNLAFGSALASIGLTIPAVVVVALVLDLPLVLGLEAKNMILLVLSLFVCAIGLGNGRANMMQGAVQVVIFAAFLFLSMVP
ncbi:MAG: ionic transporter y4hA [Gammaproteobacteria bacterium]|nr:ionic transporter y4hA [Gammaproteobacteria bacterium]